MKPARSMSRWLTTSASAATGLALGGGFARGGRFLLDERFADAVLVVVGDACDDALQLLVEERQEARRQRNFARSDEIRDLLAGQGIVLEDTKEGVRWKRK